MIQTLLTMPGDSSQRRCYDCAHCQAALSWWCVNPDAIKARGSQIPGVRDCPYWESAKTVGEVIWWKRLLGNYIILDNREARRA